MKGKINLIDLTIISTILVVGTVFIELPARLAQIAQQSGWLGVPIACTLGVLLALVVCWLGRRFPGQTPVGYMEAILGKPIGKLLAIGVACLLIGATAWLVRDFAVTILVGTQPLVPISLLMIILLLLLAFMAYWGIEVIARTAIIFLPYIVVSPIIVTLGNLRFSEFGRLLPVLGAGLRPIGGAAYTTSVYFGEIFLMATALPRVRNSRRAPYALAGAALLAAPPLAAVAISSIAVFGPAATARSIVPALDLARMVNLGEALQRIEAVFVVFWMMSAMIKVGIFMWVVCETIAETINLENYRTLLPSIAALVFVLAMLPQSFWDQAIAFKILISILPAMFYGVPVLLAIVALIRRKGGQADSGQQ